jgi:proline iminopeptidase
VPAAYPPIEPYDRGLLEVGDGNRIYWETSGNPSGKPAVFLHAGPGASARGPRKAFDPSRYRIILFDQRGCGESLPHASATSTSLRHNTTEHLIGDMERLRTFLGVERWLLFGGSWGCTLALAYAERHPERVTEIVLASVSTSRRSEIDWLYRGVRRFFPEAWERFRGGVPEAERDDAVVAAYARRMDSPEAETRTRAAAAWLAWEDTVLSLEGPAKRTTSRVCRPSPEEMAFARICSHFYAHAAWLDEGDLLRNIGRLAAIPGVLIHGRLDLSCPVESAWELSRAWAGSRLVVVDDAGHRPTPATLAALDAALDEFAQT